MDILAELEGLIQELDARQVEYALCGGFAVNIHGHVRATLDIDLLIPPEKIGNARAVARGLGFTLEAGPLPLGYGTPEAREMSLPSGE